MFAAHEGQCHSSSPQTATFNPASAAASQLTPNFLRGRSGHNQYVQATRRRRHFLPGASTYSDARRGHGMGMSSAPPREGLIRPREHERQHGQDAGAQDGEHPTQIGSEDETWCLLRSSARPPARGPAGISRERPSARPRSSADRTLRYTDCRGAGSGSSDDRPRPDRTRCPARLS